MKKLFLLTLLCTAALIAWNGKDCVHIYVAVEQPEIQVNQTGTFSFGLPQTLTGKHEGKELICVKCFNRINQVLDFGNPKNVDHSNYHQFNGQGWGMVADTNKLRHLYFTPSIDTSYWYLDTLK